MKRRRSRNRRRGGRRYPTKRTHIYTSRTPTHTLKRKSKQKSPRFSRRRKRSKRHKRSKRKGRTSFRRTSSK
jgi:hypothetical protein